MLRRRRNAYPRPGDRISLAAPPPAAAGGLGAERSGTVLERSTGRSGALLVRWDASSNRSGVATETWLSDAVWQWEHGNLKVIDGKAPAAAPEQRRGPLLEGEDTWLAAHPRQRDDATDAGAARAVDDWEAAMRSEVDPAEDDGWEAALAAALGLAGPPPAPAAEPAPPGQPHAPARFAPSGQAASPDGAVGAPAPAHRVVTAGELVPVAAAPRPTDAGSAPAPEQAASPAPAAEPRPGSRAPWIGDDILPNRRKGGGRGGKSRS